MSPVGEASCGWRAPNPVLQPHAGVIPQAGWPLLSRLFPPVSSQQLQPATLRNALRVAHQESTLLQRQPDDCYHWVT